MIDSTHQFIEALKSKEIKFSQDTTDSGKDVVSVSFDGNNISPIKMLFFFGTDSQDVSLQCFNVVKVPEGKTEAILKAVNGLNAHYRFAKFYFDVDYKTVTVQMDACFRTHDVGEICTELMIRCIQIIDDSYPSLMKALWA